MRHQLSEAEEGTILPVQVGDEIDLILHEMPSGGYRWLLDGIPDDLLEPLEQRFEFEEGKVGGRNDAHFLFRVKAAGRGTIGLTYARPWEKDEPPLKSWQATIEAR
jgi:predicted secreted protein